MQLLLRNKRTYTITRKISAGEEIKENEEVTMIELEIKNKNIENEYIVLVEELLNVIVLRLDRNNNLITEELQDIDNIIIKYDNEQMKKFGLILQLNDITFPMKKLDIREVRDIIRIAKEIDNYVWIEEVHNLQELGKLIEKKSEKINCQSIRMPEYMKDDTYYEDEAETYMYNNNIQCQRILNGYIIDIGNAKENKQIRKFLENIKDTKEQTEDEEFE